jgi:hypothetical protein
VTAWIVVLCVVLALVGLGCIRLGAELSYDEDGFAFAACVGGITLRLGTKKSKPSEKQPPEAENASPEPDKKKRGLPPWPILKILGKNGYTTLCRLVSRLRVDVLKIHFTAAWADPAVTAMAYSAAGVAMEGLLQIGGRRIAHPDLLATVDFDSEKPLLDLRLRLSLRVYQLLGAALGFGLGVLKDFIKLKMKREKDG